MFVVWSYKHHQWWRDDFRGYTPHLDEAGRYNAHQVGQILQMNIFGQNVPIWLPVAAHMGAPTVKSMWERKDPE